MPPAKSKWDDEESESTPPSSPPPAAAIARRGGRFDDEEEESDVVDDWQEEEDSEAEREKAKKAAEAQAKAEAEAKANKKSKTQRIEEHRMAKMRQRQQEEDAESSEEEDTATQQQRMRRMEKEADLKNAEDLFGGAGSGPRERSGKHITTTDPSDPSRVVDLGSLPLFQPKTREQFVQLRETLAPLIVANTKAPQFTLFMTEFTKEIARDMSSDAIKKVASSLTALSNERLKEEKAADKGSKKSKAAKTKTILNTSKDVGRAADTNVYDDGLDDGDFM